MTVPITVPKNFSKSNEAIYNTNYYFLMVHVKPDFVLSDNLTRGVFYNTLQAKHQNIGL